MKQHANALLVAVLMTLPLGCLKEPAGGPGADAGSAATPAARTSKPRYVVTVMPLQVILREVCGDRAEVVTLLKPGANAHTYDPTPADAQLVQHATGFFWVSGAFDGWAAEFDTPHGVEAISLMPREHLLDLAPHEEWPAATGHGGQASGERTEHRHPDEAAVADPHFAVDPSSVKALLPQLTSQLAKLDPPGAAEYQRNAADFDRRLAELDAELRVKLAPIAGAPVVQFHPSYNYFLRSYGLRYAGVVEPFPGKEPSPKYLQSIVRQVKSQGAKAIFTETLLPAAPAQVIGEAAAVPVVELDPSCGNSGHVYADYAAWVRYNADVFLRALQ
jgi:zinc transport system substrate-binding protein